jgi:hypothetical protein
MNVVNLIGRQRPARLEVGEVAAKEQLGQREVDENLDGIGGGNR